MGKRAGKRRHGDARLRVVQGGRTQPKRGTTVAGDAMQPLIVELRRRLRDDDPWHLLGFLASVVEASDGAPGPDGITMEIAPLAETFIGVDLAETTAALTCLTVLVEDEEVVADIDAELAHRRQPMPLWLRDLRDTRVTKAHFMSADDGLGDNIVLGLDWSGGPGASFLVYIDHARGTVVRDSFPIPAPVEEVLGRLDEAAGQEGPGNADFDIEELDLAEARSLIEQALVVSVEEDWDPESETWPASRPILQWLLRTMPEGGQGWVERNDFDDFDDLDDLDDFDDLDDDLDDLDDDFDELGGGDSLDVIAETLIGARGDLAERFEASSAATAIGLDTMASDTDRAALAIVVGGVRPMPDKEFLRWTPERVEDILFGVALRTILVDSVIARRMPEVLKALAEWCLREARASKGELTAVLDAVESSGPAFVAIASSAEAGRLRAAVRDYAMLLGDPVGIVPVLESREAADWATFLLDHAASEVGGRKALLTLDAEPLPDEDFDWSIVPADVHDAVGDVLRQLDALADERFDVEFRTACRRFLAALVAGDPSLLRRGTPESAAAVIAWLVGRSNGVVARGGGGMPAGELWEHFGVKGGASTRGQTFRKAVGLDPYAATDSLGHPEWLTSATRLSLIERRDQLARRATEGQRD